MQGSLDNSVKPQLQARECGKIYDSRPSGRVPSRTKDQIAAMILFEDKAFTLRFQPVQVQLGSSDCRLFALAFATSLCAGENPERMNYV